jgi:hypothetical protein
MPYEIIKVGSKYAVKNKQSGKLHGLTSLPKVKSQLRLLEMIMKKSGK